jgi:hypothetical protein
LFFLFLNRTLRLAPFCLRISNAIFIFYRFNILIFFSPQYWWIIVFLLILGMKSHFICLICTKDRFSGEPVPYICICDFLFEFFNHLYNVPQMFFRFPSAFLDRIPFPFNFEFLLS